MLSQKPVRSVACLSWQQAATNQKAELYYMAYWTLSQYGIRVTVETDFLGSIFNTKPVQTVLKDNLNVMHQEGAFPSTTTHTNRKDTVQFLQDLLEHTNGCEAMTFIKEEAKVTCTGLYTLFREWCALNGREGDLQELTLRMFGVNVTRVLGHSKAARVETITFWPNHPHLLTNSTPKICKVYTLSPRKIYA